MDLKEVRPCGGKEKEKRKENFLYGSRKKNYAALGVSSDSPFLFLGGKSRCKASWDGLSRRGGGGGEEGGGRKRGFFFSQMIFLLVESHPI